jgi:hypothetical protein
MSVRIVKQNPATQGTGWHVSRRAFLAQSTALMVALGMPLHQAKAVAGQLYQAGETKAVNGFAEEVVFSISSRYTHAFSADARASVHQVVRELCQQAGLSDFDIHIDWNDASFASTPVRSLVKGNEENVTVGEAVGRAVAQKLSGELQSMSAEAAQTVASRFDMPARAKSLLDDGFTVASLKDSGAAPESNDPVNVFDTPEKMIVDRMLSGLPRSAKNAEATLPAPFNQRVDVGLAGEGAAFQQELASAVSKSWLAHQFSDAEYAEARRFVEKLASGPLMSHDALRAVGMQFVQADMSGINPVNVVLAKSADLTANPGAILNNLETRLDSAQSEMNASLERFDTLSQELSGLPLHFAENVPEQRYILSDSGGADEILAQEMVAELNLHHQRATELAQEVVNLQIQVEDLSVEVYDEEVFGGKFAALNDLVGDSVSGLLESVSTLQHLEPSLASVDAQSYKGVIETAVAELHELMEHHKELASFDMAPRDWALTKAYASQMLVQLAQLESVLGTAVRADGESAALAAVLKTFGRFNGHAPLENLDALTREQLIIHTENAAQAAVEVLRSVRDGVASADAPEENIGRIAKVLGAFLAESDAAFEKEIGRVSVGSGASIAELAAAAGVKTDAALVLKAVGADLVAGGVSLALSEKLLAALQGTESLGEAFANRNAAEVSASSIHFLGFELAKVFMKEPVESVLRNYCGSLLHGSLSATTADASAFGVVSDEARSEAVAASEASKLRVEAVTEALARASSGASSAVVAHALPVAAEQARTLVKQQSKRALGVELG